MPTSPRRMSLAHVPTVVVPYPAHSVLSGSNCLSGRSGTTDVLPETPCNSNSRRHLEELLTPRVTPRPCSPRARRRPAALDGRWTPRASCVDNSCGSPGGYLLSCLRIGKEVNAVALSDDGRFAAVGLQDYSVQLWDMVAQTLVRVLRGHKNLVNDVAYSRDGGSFASASADKLVKVWNTKGHCMATLVGHALCVSSVAFSSDGTRIASGSWDRTVCIWEVSQHVGEGRAIRTLRGHSDWVHSVAWAPDGLRVASGSSDSSVRVWSVATGFIERVLTGHVQTVSSVSFSSTGGLLASGSLDGSLRVWDVQGGWPAKVFRPDAHGPLIHSVAFALDDRVVAGCSDRSVCVWNLETGMQESRLCGHQDAVLGVCISDDGTQVASCGHDKTLRLWRMPIRRLATQALPKSPKQSPSSSSRALRGSGLQSPSPSTVAPDTEEDLVDLPAPLWSGSVEQHGEKQRRHVGDNFGLAKSMVELPSREAAAAIGGLRVPLPPAARRLHGSPSPRGSGKEGVAAASAAATAVAAACAALVGQQPRL